jgi:hypothetical protein
MRTTIPAVQNRKTFLFRCGDELLEIFVVGWGWDAMSNLLLLRVERMQRIEGSKGLDLP